MSAASTRSSVAPRPDEYAEQRRELLATAAPGAGRRRGLAALTDAWLRELMAEAVRSSGADPTRSALVAVGGYGRGELAPGSDLDLLLLHADRDSLAGLADKVWYPVWDTGVRLDHAVRTVEQARRLASNDLAVLLGLLDARLVAGEGALVDRLRAGVLGDWRAGARRRLPELHAAWQERVSRGGDLRHDLEPDLKDGRGGLRDHVLQRAIAASWVADRPHAAVDEAVRRLADVRDCLHLATRRSGNRLVLQEQDQVAHDLGLADADALLRHVGAAAATVAHATDVTWRRALHTSAARRPVLGRGRRPALRLLGPGLAEHDGEAVLTGDADPAGDPVLPVRFAARAARAGLALAPSSLDRLVARAPAMPEPWPDPARQLFVELLGAGPALVPVWEALDQAGLVARLLPEWGTVRHRPQRNALHRWSVDRHLVETAVQAAALVREVRRPDLLLVAALLHDVGKGGAAGEDHSAAGVAPASAVATRLGFDRDDVATVGLLVRHHLLLAETATRRDLDDPATASAVVSAVDDPDRLALLGALTRADGLATGPGAWSAWKAGLVDELVRRSAALLHGEPPPAPAPLTGAQSALARAGRLGVHVEALPVGWQVTVAAPDRPGLFAAIAGVLALHRLPVRSAQVGAERGTALDVWVVVPEHGHEPRAEALRTDLARALAGELDLTGRLAARDAGQRQRSAPVAPARAVTVPDASRDATVVEVRAGDRPGLLHRLGAALAGAGVDVAAARVVTLGAEAVDTFYLRDTTGRPLDAATAAHVEASLVAAAG